MRLVSKLRANHEPKPRSQTSSGTKTCVWSGLIPTLVYLISGLGTGEGISCRDAMSAAGSAFSPPGSCTALEVMLWPARSRSQHRLHAEFRTLDFLPVFISRCRHWVHFLLGSEYRGRPPDIIKIQHLHKPTLSLWQIGYHPLSVMGESRKYRIFLDDS